MPHLTDSYIDSLPPAKDERGYVVRDDDATGLIVRVGKKKKTFRFEIAHRVGDQRYTISKNLGSRPKIKTAEARAAAKLIDGERLNGKAPASKTRGVTLQQAADAHFAALGDTRWRKEAEGFYNSHLSHWANRSLASLSGSPEVVALHADISKRKGKRGGTYAANHSMRVLRAIYNRWREEHGPESLPPDPPTLGMRRRWNPQPRADKAIPFQDFPKWAKQVDEIEKHNAVRAAHHRLCVLLGMRPGELARLRWADVDCRKRTLTVGKSKTGIDITVPMSSAIAQQLKLARDAGRKLVDGSPWLFPAVRGESGHISHWREDKRTLDHHGNAGRHSYRTVGASLGIDELTIRLLQGHSLSGISQGYVTRALLVGTSLRAAQRRISKRIVELMRPKTE